MLNKKHYIAIAKVLRDSRLEHDDFSDIDKDIEDKLVSLFMLDNPKFDKNKFIRACRPII